HKDREREGDESEGRRHDGAPGALGFETVAAGFAGVLVGGAGGNDALEEVSAGVDAYDGALATAGTLADGFDSRVFHRFHRTQSQRGRSSSLLVAISHATISTSRTVPTV